MGDLVPSTTPPAVARYLRDETRPQRQDCPAPAVCCGLVDGTLWQIHRRWAVEVRDHARACPRCAGDVHEWEQSLTAGERLAAGWRRLPLSLRAVLAVLVLLLAIRSEWIAVEVGRQPWQACPATGHWYLLAGQFDNVEAARAAARRSGGYLATIGDPSELEWLDATFSDQLPEGQTAWLGLREVGRHGNWEWETGEPLTFVPWEGTQPFLAPDDRRRVAAWVEGEMHAFSVPAGPREPEAKYALFERNSPPFGRFTRGELLALGYALAGLLLLTNLGRVLAARRRFRRRWQGDAR